MPAKVYYNGKEIIGDPLVSKSHAPMDQGNRWGMVDSITLNGTLTGVSYCSKEVNGVCEKYGWQELTEDVFKANFQEFKVEEDDPLLEQRVEYLKYPSVMIDTIDFPPDKWGSSYCKHCECSDQQWTNKENCNDAGTCYDDQNAPVPAGDDNVGLCKSLQPAGCDDPNCTTQTTCEGDGAGECDSNWTEGNYFIPAHNSWGCTRINTSTRDICEDNDDYWHPGGALKYTVKLKAYDVFSKDNVIDPSDSYSFTENEDGSVNVAHKVSAKGVKTNTSTAFDNAVSFVNQYVGVDHYSTNACSPLFLQNGDPILLNQSESSDRLAGMYSITENYKFQPLHSYRSTSKGKTAFIKTSKTSMSESTTADLHTINYEAQYQTDASHGVGNLINDVRKEINNKEVEKELFHNWSAIHTKGQMMSDGTLRNITRDDFYRTSFSINEDLDAHSLNYKATYVIGQDQKEMARGYLDTTVTMSTDSIIDTTIWTVDSQYKTFGSLWEKKEAIKKFKKDSETRYNELMHAELLHSNLYDLYSRLGGYGSETEGCSNLILSDNSLRWGESLVVHKDECTVNGGTWDEYKIEGNNSNHLSTPHLTSLRVTENPWKASLSINATFTDEDRVSTGTEFRVDHPYHHRYLEEAPYYSFSEKNASYPPTLWTNNPDTVPKKAKNASSEYSSLFTWGDLPMGYPIKYNVSITESIDTFKLLPSANVEGMFALQDMQCKTLAKTKINVNGTRLGRDGEWQGMNVPDENLLQDAKYHTLKNVERVLFQKQDNAWRTDTSNDQTLPNSSTADSVEYTYSPSEDKYWDWQREIYDNVSISFVDMTMPQVRKPGKKFGF
jgi:hypothetical protein